MKAIWTRLVFLSLPLCILSEYLTCAFGTDDLSFCLRLFMIEFKIGPETVFCKVSNVLMNRNRSFMSFCVLWSSLSTE